MKQDYNKIFMIFGIIITSLMIILLFSGCNQSYGWGNLSFKHIHFSDYCATVDSWHDSEGPGIEVKTKEYGSLFLSEGTYVMFENGSKCPFCK